VNIYDVNWVKHEEWVGIAHRNNVLVDKPNKFNEMLEYARILSKGFPQVRIDLYECGDKIYFGEMTFTSFWGHMDYFSPEFLILLGNKCKLDKD